MTNSYKNFEDVIKEVFTVFSENRITLDEISKTYDIDVQFLKALLNEDRLIISNITRLLEASNVRLKTRKYPFKGYSYRNRDTYIKITRNIKPRCSIVYDKINKEWHSLIPKNKDEKIGHNKKYMLLDDFKKFKKTFIDKKNN